MDPSTVKLLLSVGRRVARSRLLRRMLGLALAVSVVALGVVVLTPMIIVGQLGQAGRNQAGLLNSDCAPELGQSSAAVIVKGNGLGLSAEQLKNAQQIVAVSKALHIPSGGAVVALAAALQESALRNLDHGDRDSLGLFQQRPSSGWGTTADIRDVPRSVAAFFGVAQHTHNPGLLDIAGWQTMPVGVAAQAVQRSAFPSAYDDDEPLARRLAAQFAGSAEGTILCGASGALDCPASGLSIENGLLPDTLRVLRCVHQRWPQITSWAGVGDRPAGVDRDHQEGRAVDVMLPRSGPTRFDSAQGVQLGDSIGAWVIANRKALGVSYVIWNARIWSVARASEGWRPCGTSQASCYGGSDVTAAHRDHVHVSTYGNMAGTSDGDPASGAARGRIVAPVRSYVLTAGFGQCGSSWAHCHTGQDFAAPGGTRISAVTDGQVTFVGLGGAYGNLTKIRHGGGVETWYAHQLRQTVRVGEQVVAGEQIGEVGWTGNVRPRGPGGAHLHLEVRIDGSPVDPLGWLRARGVRV